jgi:multidrug efflux pump
VFSQALTLYTTPVIYLWFDRLAKRFGWSSETEVDEGLDGDLAMGD